MPTHSEMRKMPFLARDMYDLVADIESYPRFLPWCAAARIRSRQPSNCGEKVDADLVIAFKAFRETFRSRVELREDALEICIEYLDGPLERMESQWNFRPLPNGDCRVEFQVDYRFRTGLFNKLVKLVFHHVTHRVVQAFEERARKVYGQSGH